MCIRDRASADCFPLRGKQLRFLLGNRGIGLDKPRCHFLNPAHEVGGAGAALCNPCLLYTSLRYFKSEVMEMGHREGLYQIDLLNGSKNRVTDREYWAQKKGQAALDKQNACLLYTSRIYIKWNF